MRVLIAHSFYRIPGGEDRYVNQQVGLLQGDHTIELLAARNEDLSGGVSTTFRMVGSPLDRAKLEKRIARFKPDVIHLHNAYPSLGPSVHLAARRLRIPLAMTVHNYRLRCPNGLMFTEGQPCRRCIDGNHSNAITHHCFPSRAQAIGYAAALWVHRFALHLEDDVSLFITPSEFMQSTLTSWGIARHRVRTIRNFTDVSTEVWTGGSRGLYLGRLSAEKGLDVLLHALATAGDPDFTIAGEGLYEKDLKRLATDLGLRNVRFLGRVDHDRVPELLSDARFLALPSIWDENAPLAALEAMAHGIPLLVSDKGGLPELADDGRGIVCKAGDPTSFAEGMARLSSAKERGDLGQAALWFAQRYLTPAAHRLELENAYQDVIERHAEARLG